MKITELMLGDWYKWEAEGKSYFYRVTKETFNEEESTPNFQPIPLTAEILGKNGIKFQFGKVWYQLHNDRIQLAWEHDGDTIRICVDCVHELQHALRLCGLNELADDFQV